MDENMKVGILAVGAYIPYYYMERAAIGKAWGERGGKGRRSICNSDEDSLTMSVEAVRDCLYGLDKGKIDNLFSATTTSAYQEKSGATLIATASCLRSDILSVDFNSSVRSGAAALKLAFDSAATGAETIVVAADKRVGAPKSGEEKMFGDAAAAALVGQGDVIAECVAVANVDDEIHDYWRNDNDRTVNTTEARFMMEKGYEAAMPKAIKAAMSQAGLSGGQINKLALSTPDLKAHIQIAKKGGVPEDRIQDPLMMEVGNCGCAHMLLILASALETARPGDMIVAAQYGSGATAFIFRVTERINDYRNPVVTKYMNRRAEFTDYARFLSFNGLVTPKQGEPFKIPAAPSITWREQNTYLRLEAGTCTKCGCKTFPADRVCYNCRSKDSMTVESRTEAKSTLFSFSIDRLAGRSDDPLIVQAIGNDDQNIRFYMNMTDVNESEIGIGMELEFTFRRIHNLANLPNYYWKYRPVRFKR